MERQKYKNILITGANSLLGTNVVRAFAARGEQVRALVRRSNAELDRLAAEGSVELVYGNVVQTSDLERALTNCDAVVHIAAITDQSLPRYAMYQSFNVGGLETLVEAMRTAGVERLVYVSSANTVGNGTAEHPADEKNPAAPPFSKMYYGRSKVEAEAFLATTTDINYTIVNPTFMLGPFDSKPSSGKLIMMGYGKRLIFSPSGGKNFVSVEAVAGAIVTAIEKGRRGERYLLGGVNMSLRDFFKILNPQAWVVVIPRFLVVRMGFWGDLLRWFGVHTPLSINNDRVVCTQEYYTAQKAKRELGLADTDLAHSIDQAVAWFRANGMLK